MNTKRIRALIVAIIVSSALSGCDSLGDFVGSAVDGCHDAGGCNFAPSPAHSNW